MGVAAGAGWLSKSAKKSAAVCAQRQTMGLGVQQAGGGAGEQRGAGDRPQWNTGRRARLYQTHPATPALL